LTLATEADGSVLQLLEVRLSRREQPLLNMLRQRISKVDLKPVDPDWGAEILAHLVCLLSIDYDCGIRVTGRSRLRPLPVNGVQLSVVCSPHLGLIP
jgi:hypothetical protein